jgi:hypothetical protein
VLRLLWAYAPNAKRPVSTGRRLVPLPGFETRPWLPRHGSRAPDLAFQSEILGTPSPHINAPERSKSALTGFQLAFSRGCADRFARPRRRASGGARTQRCGRHVRARKTGPHTVATRRRAGACRTPARTRRHRPTGASRWLHPARLLSAHGRALADGAERLVPGAKQERRDFASGTASKAEATRLLLLEGTRRARLQRRHRRAFQDRAISSASGCEPPWLRDWVATGGDALHHGSGRSFSSEAKV